MTAPLAPVATPAGGERAHVSGTTHANDKEHLMAHFVRAAWSQKATPKSKTHLTAAPLSSTAPFVLTYCGLLADGADIVYQMSTHLIGRDKNCKRCVAAAEAAPEVHAGRQQAANDIIATELAGLDIDAAIVAADEPAFELRLAAAIESAYARYAERDNFLSDDDLLDIADMHTTDAPWAEDEDGSRERPDHNALVEALYTALYQSEDEPVDPRSWAAVRQTPAFAVALDIARQERISGIRLHQARTALDAVKVESEEGYEAADTFRAALAAWRNDNNVLWGAARVVATLVDNDDALGVLEALRMTLDVQDGIAV